MSENTTPARCSEQEWVMARDAGLPFFTTADEIAIHKFAEAVRAEEPVALQAFRRDINEKLDRAYQLEGRHQLTDRDDLRDESERLFAEVRERLAEFRRWFDAKGKPAASA